MIQSIICNCFNATKRSFCVNMWQWMKHRSTTSLQSLIGSQLSGQQQVKAIQSDQRCKHLQAKFWPPYFGMCKVFCSLITLRKEEPLIVNITLEIPKKTATNEEKHALSPRQCTVSQVDHNNGKTTWIASTPTLFSRSGPQWLLTVCRPQKNAPGKEIWFQWRSNIGNWGVPQKRHQIVREVLESVHHSRRRLCWWIKLNFA